MTHESEDTTPRQNEGITGDPRRVSQCGHHEPGTVSGAGHDKNEGIRWARRHADEDPEEQPAPQRASRPEPKPLVQEKFRKTELHNTPPVPRLRDQVLRKNSIRYLAGQIDSTQDRLDTVECHLERGTGRLDRRITELEERGRWT
jgi:hypothetical protein